MVADALGRELKFEIVSPFCGSTKDTDMRYSISRKYLESTRHSDAGPSRAEIPKIVENEVG